MSENDWLNRLPPKWQSELRNAQLRGKLPIEDLLRFQILRCQATFDEEQHQAIELLTQMIPTSWRDEEFENDMDATHTSISQWVPVTVAGWPLSANPQDPVLNNLPNDVDYDPRRKGRIYEIKTDPDNGEEFVVEKWVEGSPHWQSPEYKTIPNTDYGALFHACMNLFDRRHLLITKTLKEPIPAGKEEEAEAEDVTPDDDES